MTRNRLVAASLCVILMTILRLPFVELAGMILYLGFAGCIALSIRAQPAHGKLRRKAAMLMDLTIISFGLHIVPETNVIFYPFYLWVILGNGFRFGIRALFQAIILGGTFFYVVIAITPYWSEHPSISLGLLITLVIPTSYSSILIWKLSQARLIAEEASRAKTLFLGTISHEIRTPLNAILGSVALIDGNKLDDADRENFAAIVVGTRSLLSLIGKTLEFSRLDAGKTPFEPVPFDLTALLIEVRNLVIYDARKKDLPISIHVARSVQSCVVTDRRLLSEVLLNLLTNAIKFTAHGWVHLDVTMTKSESGLVQLRFDLSDTGIGIEELAQSRIFESFAQVDGTIISRFGGSGLGLAISKQTVGLLGGQIGVSSQRDVGSRFWFTIPYRAGAVLPRRQPGISKALLLCSEPRARTEITGALLATGRSVKILESSESLAACLGAEVGDRATRRDALIVIHADNFADGREAIASCIDNSDRESRYCSILLVPDGSHDEPSLGVRRWFDTSLPLPATREDLTAALDRLTRRPLPIPEPSLSGAQSRAKARRALKLLVADDNIINRRVITKILEMAGHEVETAIDGEGALKLMQNNCFDLALLDVNMPAMTGVEAAIAYRASDTDKALLPMLALTADATEATATRCRLAGLDYVLTKPVDPAKLLLVIESMTEDTAGIGPGAPIQSTINKVEAANLPALQADDLLSVGGPDFARMVFQSFLDDSESLIAALMGAAQADDIGAFRDRLHTLKGCAATAGATAICSAASADRSTSVPARLKVNGVELAIRLSMMRGEYEEATVRLVDST